MPALVRASEPHAAWEVHELRAAKTLRKSSLARPACAQQRDEALAVRHSLLELVDLRLPTKKRVQPGRKVGLFQVRGLEPREGAASQGGGQQLPQVLPALQALQRVLAQVFRGRACRWSVRTQRLPGRLAHHQLPTVAYAADPCGAVHHAAEVVHAARHRIGLALRRTGVHAHADAQALE
jgi:hypothetical protein